jgi:outer membrane protein assembly factor BamB
LREDTGEFLWQLVIPKLAAGKVNDWENLGLLSSPIVEGDRVYVVTTRCEVLCLSIDGLAGGNRGPFLDEEQYIAGPGKAPIKTGPKDADIRWRYDMIDELGVFPHNGTRSQPVIVGDFLYVPTCNGVDWTHSNIPSPRAPSLIVLNKHAGQFVAEDDAKIGPRILHGQWSSPSWGRVGKRDLIFFGGGDGTCYAFDARPTNNEEGAILQTIWHADCNPGEYYYKVKEELNFPALEIAQVQTRLTPVRYPDPNGPSEIIGTPVFWRNRVFVATGQDPEHGEGVGNLVCLDATGTAIPEAILSGAIRAFIEACRRYPSHRTDCCLWRISPGSFTAWTLLTGTLIGRPT